MTEIVGAFAYFVGMTGIMMLDPINVIGYLASGIMFARWRDAMISCAVWAVAISIVIATNDDYPMRISSFAPHALVARAIGAIIIGSASWYIARRVGAWRAQRLP